MPENPEVALTRTLLEDNYVERELFNQIPPNSRFSDWAIEMLSLGIDSSHVRLLCAAPEMDRYEVETVFRHALNHHSLLWLLDEDRTYALQKRVIRDFLQRKASVETTIARETSLYCSDYGDLIWSMLEDDLSLAKTGNIPWESTRFQGSDHLDARLVKCLFDEGLVDTAEIEENGSSEILARLNFG